MGAGCAHSSHRSRFNTQNLTSETLLCKTRKQRQQQRCLVHAAKKIRTILQLCSSKKNNLILSTHFEAHDR